VARAAQLPATALVASAVAEVEAAGVEGAAEVEAAGTVVGGVIGTAVWLGGGMVVDEGVPAESLTVWPDDPQPPTSRMLDRTATPASSRREPVISACR
jgi:hypothetical protein